MASSSPRLIAQRYAESWLAAASDAKALDAVGKDVDLLRESIKADPAIVRQLDSPVASGAALHAAVDALVKAHKLHALTGSALHVLLKNRRMKVLPYVLMQMQEHIAMLQGELPATVITAAALNDAQQKQYAAAVEKAAGKKIHCDFIVRPGILGGAIVRLGPMQLDASLQGKLQRLTARMQRGMASA